MPPWMRERLFNLSDEHAARISLSGPHAPRALDGLDPARAGRDLLPYLPETGEVVNRMTTSWCIVPVPTPILGRDGVPGHSTATRRYELLWEDVAHICRLDEDDPSAAWVERCAALKANAQRLTDRRFDALRLHGPGTDLTIGLFQSGHWAAGDLETVDGRRHSPNIPTEEVFGTPDPERVDGLRLGDDAARALGFDHRGHPRGVRRRPGRQDRRRLGSRRSARGHVAGRGRLPPRRDRARRRRRSHRAARAESSTTRFSTRTPRRTSRSAAATSTRSTTPPRRRASTRASSTSTS